VYQTSLALPRGPCDHAARRLALGAALLASAAVLAFSPGPAWADGFTLGLRYDLAAGAGAVSIAAADFNNDGHVDLVVANRGGTTVSVFLGLGGGRFGTRSDYTVGAAPAAVAIADFNGEGRLDIATANGSGNSVSVLLGNGAGGFGARTD